MFFAMGSLFALISRRTLIAQNPRTFGPSAWASVGYALFFWAVVTWMVIAAPDWMLSYTIPAQDVSLIAVHALFAVALVVASLSGHTLTAVAVQRGRTGVAITVFITGLVMWFGLWTLTFDRYMAMGSFQEWTTGVAVPLIQSDVATDINVMGLVDVAGWIVPVVLLVRRDRRLRPA